jgi:hypothetical protein
MRSREPSSQQMDWRWGASHSFSLGILAVAVDDDGGDQREGRRSFEDLSRRQKGSDWVFWVIALSFMPEDETDQVVQTMSKSCPLRNDLESCRHFFSNDLNAHILLSSPIQPENREWMAVYCSYHVNLRFLLQSRDRSWKYIAILNNSGHCLVECLWFSCRFSLTWLVRSCLCYYLYSFYITCSVHWWVRRVW